MVRNFFLLLCFFAISQAFAQQNPTKWTFTATKVKKGEYKIALAVELQDKWAIYSQTLESNDGPVPTSIVFEPATGAELVGKAAEEGDKIAGFDDVFGMNVVKYKKKVKFVQTVKAKKGTKIKGSVTFMVCNDDSCLPPRDVPFEVSLK